MNTDKHHKLRIKGMHCSSCIQKIKTKLTPIPGINHIHISLNDKQADISWNPNVNALAIQQAVEQINILGYEATIVNTNNATCPTIPSKTSSIQDSSAISKTNIHPSLLSIHMEIQGMTCASCATSIENALLSSDAIHHAAVHFGLSKLNIKYTHNLDLEQLKKLIQSAGSYGIKTEKRSYQINTTSTDIPKLASKIQSELQDKIQSKLCSLKIVNSSTLEAEWIPALIKGKQLHTLLQEIIQSNKTIHLIDIAPVQIDKSSSMNVERNRLITSIILSIPILMLTMLANLFNIPTYLDMLTRHWIVFLLTTPVQFFCGYPFLIGAYRAITYRKVNMNSLVALGTLSSYIYSVFLLITQPNTPNYFESAALIITFLLIGRWMENKAKRRTSKSIQKLIQLQSKWARVIKNNQEHEVEIEHIQIGDHILVKPGERIPVDAKVLEGNSHIDQSMLTGESAPVKVSPGKRVYSSTINQTGILLVQSEKMIDDSLIARMIKLVEQAQTSKPAIQKLVDRIASIFVPIVIIIAFSSFIFWITVLSTGIMTTQGSILGTAIKSMVAVLIISCPCAMGLATPTVMTVAINLAAKHHILIKNPQSLEIIPALDIIAFDKTGTLTEGKMQVESIVTTPEYSERKIIQAIVPVEQYSIHPIAKAIMLKATELNIGQYTNQYSKEAIETLDGLGIIYKDSNHTIHIGNEALMTKYNLAIPKKIKTAKDTQIGIQSSVFVAIENKVCALIQVSDTLKTNTIHWMRQIQTHPIKTALLTGDKKATANYIYGLLKLDEFKAELLPQDKINWIRNQQKNGNKVAMIGDGTNDAAALTQADVGICMASGTDVALESADVTLMKSELGSVLNLMILTKETLKKIRSNLFWAFFYNSLAIPLAFAGLLSPIFAALAMSMSSVSVIVNALFLNRAFKRHQRAS